MAPSPPINRHRRVACELGRLFRGLAGRDDSQRKPSRESCARSLTEDDLAHEAIAAIAEASYADKGSLSRGDSQSFACQRVGNAPRRHIASRSHGASSRAALTLLRGKAFHRLLQSKCTRLPAVHAGWFAKRIMTAAIPQRSGPRRRSPLMARTSEPGGALHGDCTTVELDGESADTQLMKKRPTKRKAVRKARGHRGPRS